MITYDYFTPPSILSPNKLEDVLNLKGSYISRYSPIDHRKPYGWYHALTDVANIYLDHSELDVIQRIFTETKSASNEPKIMNLLLALEPSKETILQTQEFVKELGTNDGLYNNIKSLIKQQPIFYRSGWEQGTIYTMVSLSTERTQSFLQHILSLQKHNPTSQSMKSVFSWIDYVFNDPLYKQVLEEKEYAKSTRIISIAEPQFGEGLRYARLKPGVNLEDFVDLIDPEVESFVNTELQRDDPDFGIKKYFVRQSGWTKAADETIVLSSTQNLQAANEKIVEMLTTGLFSLVVQLNHALSGANYYRYLKNNGYAITFPKILSDKNRIETKEMYPTRILLNKTSEDGMMKEMLEDRGELTTPMPVDFVLENLITQIEGPNENGKSELMRTFFLNTLMTNSGWPVSAQEYNSSIFPAAHFFKFKKSPGTGGSELKSDIKRLLDGELRSTFPGDLIFLDEVGDATNDPTSKEFQRRLFPLLKERENLLLFTTHQQGSRSVVHELGGIVYKPSGNPKNIYQPVVAEGETDYKPNEVLDKMKVTAERIKSKLPTKRPKYYKKTF